MPHWGAKAISSGGTSAGPALYPHESPVHLPLLRFRHASLETTVPVQHGNSGGALVDFATGWVIGVINAKLESRAGISADNVSYAIKGRVVRTFLDSVPAAKAAVDANPPKSLDHGDERAVIDRATQSAVLILRRR